MLAFGSAVVQHRGKDQVSRLVSHLCLVSLPSSSSAVALDLTDVKALTIISVTSYSTATASLRLGHLYPSGTNVTASVDLRLVLELVNPELTRVGEWVNVLGYKIAGKDGSDYAADSPEEPAVVQVQVQALHAWSTGPLDIRRYERSFETRSERLP
jgi:hypothetical protein